MGIYDRDYMRRGPDAPPPDEPLDDRLAGWLTAFLRRHPRWPVLLVGILVAIAVATLLVTVFSP